MGFRVRLLAPAKVNLTLDVLGRRADGYHDLASVMATVDLRDDVRVATAKDLRVVTRPDVGAPRGQDLSTQAARAFARAVGVQPRGHIVVRKRIPVAAGLGGGSSDAGAVLRALTSLTRMHGIDLVAVAAEVGSDVPFFAAGHPLALISGRGERVEPLPAPMSPLWISLVVLPQRLATKDVFAGLGGSERSAGRATEELAALVVKGALTARAVRELAHNDLAPAAERALPRIAEIRELANGLGIDLHISGSGPSLFAVADDRAHAIRMSRALRRAGLRARPHALCVAAPLSRV